jgi:transglutaminase-like putative cysteine protease
MKVDRLLRLTALIFALWSFTTLVSTAQVGLIPAAVCYAAFAAVILWSRPLAQLSDRFWIAANLFAVVFSIALGYGDLGTALVFATVYLQVQKLVRYKSPHDYLWLFALSFFQVVLAAAITVDLTFFITLVAFLFLAVVGLVLLTLERVRFRAMAAAGAQQGIGRPLNLAFANGTGGQPANGPSRPAAESLSVASVERIKPGTLPVGYLAKTFLVWVVICLVATLFFMAVPRLAVRKVFMHLRPFDPPVVVGFTDQVMVGALGDARRDRTPVMYVWVDGSPQSGFWHGNSPLRLRGLAIDSFDGVKWVPKRNWTVPLSELAADRRFPFAFDSAHVMKLRIDQELGQVRWFFGTPFIADLRGFSEEVNVQYFTDLHSFRQATPMDKRVSYRVKSFLESPLQEVAERIRLYEQAAAAGFPFPDPYARWTLTNDEHAAYTQLPQLTKPPRVGEAIPRRAEIEQLAREVTKTATNNLDRVRLLNLNFHGNYSYSDTVDDAGASSQDSTPNFILENRKGHCEMFASAMAIMCRMLDIPARLVSGFYTTEFNRYDKFYYVRQSHAHTWVEVFLDGYGWLTVDPTPPSALAEGGRFLAVFDFAREYWDSWTVSWRRYVVDFSLADQWQVLVRFRRFTDSYLPFFKIKIVPDWLRNVYARRLVAQPRGGIQMDAPGVLLVMLAIFAPVGVALILARYYDPVVKKWRFGWLWRRRRAAACPIEFYARALAALARAGWLRLPDQTPAEFAEAVAANAPSLAEFVPLTRVYYRVRFASSPLHPDERKLADRFLKHAKSQRRAQ